MEHLSKPDASHTWDSSPKHSWRQEDESERFRVRVGVVAGLVYCLAVFRDPRLARLDFNGADLNAESTSRTGLYQYRDSQTVIMTSLSVLLPFQAQPTVTSAVGSSKPNQT